MKKLSAVYPELRQKLTDLSAYTLLTAVILAVYAGLFVTSCTMDPKVPDIMIASYIVQYNANNGAGTVPEQKTVKTHETINPSAENTTNLVRDGYVFRGWSESSAAVEATTSLEIVKNTTLYAVWDPYYVTVKAARAALNPAGNGIIAVAPRFLPGGPAAGELPAQIVIPSVWEGATVSGLAKNAFKGCTGITSLTVPSSVTQFGDGALSDLSGLTELKIESAAATFGDGVFANLPAGVMIEFKNATIARAAVTAGLPADNVKKYTVTYVSEQGTVPTDTTKYFPGDTVTVGSLSNLQSPYTFVDWYTTADFSGTKVDTTFVITADVTLYARLRDTSKFSITFNENGGKGVMPPLLNQTGTITLPANTFTRAKANFKGWSEKADGSGPSYADGASFTGTANNDYTLYAQWEITAQIYKVTFNQLNGTTPTVVDVIEDEKVAKPADPSRPEFTFAGWYTNESFTDESKYNFFNPVTKNITLYAKWSGHQWTWMGVVARESADPSIAAASDGTVYVAFRENAAFGSTSSISVSKNTAGTWSFVGTSKFDLGDDPVMLLDPSEIPYVVYNSDSGLTVRKWTGSAWEAVGTKWSAEYKYELGAVFNGNTLYVASKSENDILVQKLGNNDTWEPVGTKLTFTSLSPLSMAVSESGIVHIAYWSGSSLVVDKFNGTAWERLGGNNAFSDRKYAPVLQIQGETPYVASYGSTGANNYVSVRKYESGAWSLLGGDRVSNELVSGDRLTVDFCINTSGHIFLFRTMIDSYKPTVLYQKWTGSQWSYPQVISSNGQLPSATIKDNAVYVAYDGTDLSALRYTSVHKY